MTSTLKSIPTRDNEGYLNGFVLPIWNSSESDWRPEQVYLTVVSPNAVKGPHLHMKRAGRFVVIKGEVLIVTKHGDEYREHVAGERHGYKVIHVEPGTPAALYSICSEDSYVLNLPSPPWKRDDQDEWPVEGWTYKLPEPK